MRKVLSYLHLVTVFLSDGNLPGCDNLSKEEYISWQSLSLGMINVTHMKVLQRKRRREPAVVNDNFSTEAICM